LRALNAGCGSGELTVVLAASHDWEVAAIDVEPEAVRMVEASRALGAPEYPDRSGRDREIPAPRP
jgi:methylase of polypeptide subunit release factors